MAIQIFLVRVELEFMILLFLPSGMMFLGKTDQILDLNGLSVIGNDFPIVTSKHLVHFSW